MKRLFATVTLALVALTACGSGGDSQPEAAAPVTPTEQPVTTATTGDPLEVALGHDVPADLLAAFEELCAGFTLDDPVALKTIADSNDPASVARIRTAFGVLCPSNVAKLDAL